MDVFEKYCMVKKSELLWMLRFRNTLCVTTSSESEAAFEKGLNRI